MTSLLKSNVSFVAHWVSVPGDSSSNPGGGEKFSSRVFEAGSRDCHLPTNYEICHTNSIST